MQLHVYQSTWGMTGLPWRSEVAWTVEEQIERIAEAGFDGISISFTNAEVAKHVCGLAIDRGLRIEAAYFPTTVEELAPVFETIDAVGREHVDHLNLQPNVRPMTPLESIPYLLGWQQLADDAGVPMFVETHRDRMTTDLLFTLQLIDAVPTLQLTADLSHFVVGREFMLPLDDVNRAMMSRIVQRASAYHGRVASREQVQIQTSFPHHKPWLDLFAGWWREGFDHFQATRPEGSILTFTPELGPPFWYSITGADGEELSDRWAEALQLKDLARSLWAEVEQERAAA